MNFSLKLKNFVADDDGAVTVDWVVLTAAVVGLGVAAVSVVSNSMEGVADKIGAAVTASGTESLGD